MENGLRQRRNAEPDVPEDVALLHFNDPNWDPPSSARYSDDSFSVSERNGGQTLSSGFSTRGYDAETESRTESSYKATESKYHFSEADDEYADESPYAEVRTAVANVDDPSMPVNTFRMWFLGILITIVMSGINHIMAYRFPSVGITPLIIQLVTLPMGRFMEWVLPRTKINTFGYVWSLNPGPFNIKEHAVISAMANTLYYDSFATLIYAVQELFYEHQLTAGYKILLILSTQLLGYTYTGLIRQFLVWPASMIWPGALVQCALLNTLHRNFEKKEGSHMSRQRFFLIVTGVGAVYYFVPGYLFTGLSMFTWACWIAPKNQVVNALFGFNTGLGMGFLTFDWSMISYFSNPLVSPWWAEANVFAGFAFFMWFLAPIFYYRNVLFAKFLPISAAMGFDNTGAPYNIRNILTNGTFDEAKYQAYSPLYLPATYYVSYASQFASLTAILVHIFLWYRHDIIRQFRHSVRDERDVHSRLMSVYPDIPHWWYGLLGLISFGLAIAATHIFPTELPVWGIILAYILGLVFVVPIGIIRAITNQIVTTNVFSSFVGGYIFPNKPVAVLMFRTFSFNVMQQGITLTHDLKVGHYMKIPPRVMFMAQVVSATIAAFVMYGTQELLFNNVEGVCTPQAKGSFVCPMISSLSTSSIVWGAIGPRRMFSQGSLYWPLLFAFLVGAVAPIPFYLLARRYPSSIFRYINMPLVFSATGIMPPASGINFSSWFMTGAVFEWFMRRFHFRWWMRYNYVLAAALDSGAVIGSLLIFLLLLLPKGGIQLNWWGNTVWQKTFDAMGVPAIVLAPGETFGLTTW